METTPAYFNYFGGRKMLLTLVAIAVGTAIELLTERGLSPTFGAFLAGAVASFSAANVINTVKSLGVSGSESTQELQAAPANDPRVDMLAADLEQAKAESRASFQDTATVIQNMGNAIENLRKVVSAIAANKKVG